MKLCQTHTTRSKWEQGVRWAYTEKLLSKKSKKCSNRAAVLEERQVAAWFMACSTWWWLTAQTGKILRVGVCQQSRKGLLPVIQLTAFHNISPVVCHHWGYKLQDGTNKTFSAWNAFLTWMHKLRHNICNIPYHWNAVLLLAEVFLLCFL